MVYGRALALGLVALVVAASTAAAQPHGDKRVALIVGISAYKHIGRLDNPANDARLIAQTLRGVGFTLVGGAPQLDLDKPGFDRAVRSFGAQAQGADVALFYYAGHGLQVRGTNWLVPTSANPQREADLEYEMVDANAVLRQMEGAGTRLNLMILDACRNNPFGGRGLRSTAPGLAQMQAPEGTLISYATQPGNVALDGSDGNSPFTKALAQAVRKPGAGVFEVFNDVGLQVKRMTGGSQQPWVSSSPIDGQFYFAGLPPGTAPIAGTASPPAGVDAEIVFWQSIASSSNPADYQAYLSQYPNGRFAALAKARAQMQQQAVVVPPGSAPPSPAQPVVGIYPQTQALRPGHALQDCAECPEMIVVPAGSFTMGSPAGEAGRDADEGPQRQVTIARAFGVGKYEVTFDQWDACVAGGGCGGYRPADQGWGRGTRPAINVSWNDAKQYAEWLSRRTGKRYRLLSEAEWEYAARAGTTTPWSCGASEGCLAGAGWYSGNEGSRTQAVGTKSANAFGLHDMLGNVWEWVEDCWHDSYAGAPADGSAWVTGSNCGLRVLRGGSWNNNPRNLRSANRDGLDSGDRYNTIGFRVARTLD
jgi:formylglycine-generating enzyme required for sulfatase activity